MKKRISYLQRVQELFTPQATELDLNGNVNESYHKRMGVIRDAWMDNNEAYMEKGILQVKDARIDRFHDDLLGKKGSSIEHHATSTHLDEHYLNSEKSKKVEDLLDCLIKFDDIPSTITGEALKHGYRRELRQKMDLKALSTLSANESNVYSLWMEGKTQTEISKIKGVTRQCIYDTFKIITTKLSKGEI